MCDQPPVLVRPTDCCGHVFDTDDERIEHEVRAQKGLYVECPCGDVCCRGEPPDFDEAPDA